MYEIHSLHKYDLHPKYETEQFHTGGRLFLTFKQAQEFKKKLQKMSNSFTYKVVKIKD